jgi:hypothetical protein
MPTDSGNLHPVHQPGRCALRVLLVAIAFAAATACHSATDGGDGGVQTSDVSSARLHVPNPELTYRYRFATVNADSLLRVLARANVPVSEAWLPLEDLCMDPVGPRFTVILARHYAGMDVFDFDPGNGIRACTTRIRRYVVRR